MSQCKDENDEVSSFTDDSFEFDKNLPDYYRLNNVMGNENNGMEDVFSGSEIQEHHEISK